MGEYFHFVNRSKRLRFSAGDLGGSVKFSGIGAGLEARAFCLLLTSSHDGGAEFALAGLGAWAGDSVAVVGDHGTLSDEWDDFTVITANIIVMLHEIDGPECLTQAAERDNSLLPQLAHLVNTGRLPALAEPLEQTFGSDWRKQAKLIAAATGRQVYDIADVEL